MYISDFNQVFKDIGCRVKPTAPRAPNQNAFIERWVESIKFESLNFFIVFGKKHLDHLVASYVSFLSMRQLRGLDSQCNSCCSFTFLVTRLFVVYEGAHFSYNRRDLSLEWFQAQPKWEMSVNEKSRINAT
jgi:hypothetical protein